MPVIPGIAYSYAPKVTLEGDYSTWSEISGSPLDVDIRQISAAFISESGNFGVIHDNYVYKKLLLQIKPPEVIGSVDDTNIPETSASSCCRSITGKYIVSYDTATPTEFKIYKDGVLKQTISLDFSLDKGGVWISPSGKYIFAMDFSSYSLHIYEGS